MSVDPKLIQFIYTIVGLVILGYFIIWAFGWLLVACLWLFVKACGIWIFITVPKQERLER